MFRRTGGDGGFVSGENDSGYLGCFRDDGEKRIMTTGMMKSDTMTHKVKDQTFDTS